MVPKSLEESVRSVIKNALSNALNAIEEMNIRKSSSYMNNSYTNKLLNEHEEISNGLNEVRICSTSWDKLLTEKTSKNSSNEGQNENTTEDSFIKIKNK